MALLLFTNTADQDLAFNSALAIKSFYDAEVCVYFDDKEKVYVVAIHSADIEGPMAIVGQEEDKRFWIEVQNRLTMFGDVKITELKHQAFIAMNMLPNTHRLISDMRICIRFNYDSNIASLTPIGFATQLHQSFYPTSEMHVFTSDSDNKFELRIKDKAFLNDEDAKQVHDKLLGLMEKIEATGIMFDIMASNSDSVYKQDRAVTGELTSTILYRTGALDPIYRGEKDEKTWLEDMAKVKPLKLNFGSTKFTNKPVDLSNLDNLQLDRPNPSIVKVPAIKYLKEQSSAHLAVYNVHPFFCEFLANSEEYRLSYKNTLIVEVTLGFEKIRDEEFRFTGEMVTSTNGNIAAAGNPLLANPYQRIIQIFSINHKLRETILTDNFKGLYIEISSSGNVGIRVFKKENPNDNAIRLQNK